MKKFPLLIAIVTILIIVGGVFLLTKSDNEEFVPLPLPVGYEYFWGDGCPNCAEVQEFFDGWEDYDKANITKYEVWYNKTNNTRLSNRAYSCGIAKKDIGVPLLVTPEGECLIGLKPISDLFTNMDFDEVDEKVELENSN